MAVRKYGWDRNVVMAYQEMGTTKERSKCRKCSFCDRRDLDEVVVLLVRNVDNQIMGNAYACDPCAAEVSQRAEAEKHGGHGVNPNDDPNFHLGRVPRGRR